MKTKHSLLIVFGSLALIPVSFIWNGYVFSILWRWFLCPSLGVPAISVPAAVGMALVVGMFSSRTNDKCKAGSDKTAGDLFVEALASCFLTPALILGIGWVVLHWM